MHSWAGSAIPGLNSGWISWRMFLFILKEKSPKKKVRFLLRCPWKENSPFGAWCSFRDTFYLFVCLFFLSKCSVSTNLNRGEGNILSSYHSTSSTCFLNRNYFYFIFSFFPPNISQAFKAKYPTCRFQINPRITILFFGLFKVLPGTQQDNKKKKLLQKWDERHRKKKNVSFDSGRLSSL